MMNPCSSPALLPPRALTYTVEALFLFGDVWTLLGKCDIIYNIDHE